VLYLVSLFPCWSETFIVREIHALMRQGVEVRIISLKPHSEPMVQPDAEILLDRVIYPPASLAGSLKAALPKVLGHPLQSVRELAPLVKSLWRKPDELVKSVVSWWRTLTMIDAVRAFDPQHLHAHWATYPSSAARILAGRIGRPWSFTGHAHDIFVHDQDLAGKLNQADFSVTISGYNQKQLAARMIPRNQSRLAVIHCGVLPADLPYTAAGREAAYIVGVGRLDPIKGFIHLVEACRLLKERGTAFTCDIIGDGPLRDTLQQAIDAAGLQAQVRLTGALPQQEVRTRINRATLFVLPSVLLADGNADGIPVALMEAMACGATAISTRVSGIPELIHHEENGLLVSPGDAAELADAMARLLGDAPLRTRLAEAARRTIVQDFDADIEAGKLLALIRRKQHTAAPAAEAAPGQPRRVMLMTDEMEVGGSQRQIVQLALGLKARGVTCAVLYFINPSFLVEQLQAAGIETIRVNKTARVDPGFVRRLRQAIRAWAPDVVHCYSFTAELWGAIACRLLPARERPVLISSVRGTYEWYGRNQWRMKRWVSSQSASIISNSREGAEYAARQMHWPLHHFHVVHNGVSVTAPDAARVDLLRQHYLQSQDTAPPPVAGCMETTDGSMTSAGTPPAFDTLILFVGRLVEHKNLPRLLQAFAQVVKQRPRTRLLLAGSGPLHDALAAQIGQLGLQDHALLLGEQSEVPALMEAADLVVLPSLREGLSNVVLEAMALGRAVLSTPVGGIPQAIDNGRHGVLVEPTDTDALARALLTLIDDPALRERLGRAAQHKVLEQYSPPAMVSAMLKEYSRVSQR
jgi:glycosyltransferase, family 1